MNGISWWFWKLTLASVVGSCTVASAQAGVKPAPVEQSVAPASPAEAGMAFEVVTIKATDPGVSRGTYFRVQGRHVIAANVSLLDLLCFAYGLHSSQIVHGPRWLDTSRYDIDGVLATEERPNREQQRHLFQALLPDRFGLVFHYEERELPVYALVVDKGEPKLARTSRQPQDATNFSYTNQIVLTVRNASMAAFADGMQATFLDRPAVDRTGLKDRYDFTLRWTSDDSPGREAVDAPPGLYTAIREQLGLKLIPVNAAAKVLVVDHVDLPSPN